MRAAVLQAFGTAPVLLADFPEPHPGIDDVVVQLVLAAVNPIDVWVCEGSVAAAMPPPLVPGGEGVGRLEDGTRVIVRGGGLGVSRHGTYAERVAVHPRSIVPIPEGVTDEQASGIGIAGVTALDALDLAEVGPSSTVLVLGASGGVGTFAVQLARARGARVVAQTSSPDRAGDLALRAETVIVADAEGLAAEVAEVAPQGVTAVLDGLGGDFTSASIRLVAPRGIIALYGQTAGRNVQFSPTDLYRKSAQIRGYSGLHSPAETLTKGIRRLLELVAEGVVAPTIDAVLDLADAAESHRRIAERESAGKLLLRIRS
jgi:NADPH2:quinone reductase